MQDSRSLHRYRIRFAKLEAMRYTGHLDLHRAWERMLRRASLPVAYSQGFSPRPKIHLSRALPLGMTSECELADVWLEAEMPASEVRKRLETSAPPGLGIGEVEPVPLDEPPIQSQIVSVDYIARLPASVDTRSLAQRVERLLAEASLPRERRGKRYDLRPLIEDLRLEPGDGEQEQPALMMRLAAREGATGRPEEVLLALGVDPAEARVHRTALHLVETKPHP